MVVVQFKHLTPHGRLYFWKYLMLDKACWVAIRFLLPHRPADLALTQTSIWTQQDPKKPSPHHLHSFKLQLNPFNLLEN